MWNQVGSALGYRPEGWQMAETTNIRMMYQLLDNAKSGSLFMAVSDKAGSGKTAGLRAYEAANRRNSVFYLSCREWAKREFLQNLAQSLGIEAWGKAQSIDKMLMDVVSFFKQRRAMRPLLILDEADKLRGPALRSLITLYNECEDEMALVISGTDHLEKQMRADARYNRKGAEELLSRFGARFLNLAGATDADVLAIAAANGLTDKTTVRAIFTDCQPVRRMVGNRSVEVVEDLRRVKRAILREILKQNNEQVGAAAA
jgi:type II secretory pathway predicted ATPase ExeA